MYLVSLLACLTLFGFASVQLQTVAEKGNLDDLIKDVFTQEERQGSAVNEKVCAGSLIMRISFY